MWAINAFKSILIRIQSHGSVSRSLRLQDSWSMHGAMFNVPAFFISSFRDAWQHDSDVTGMSRRICIIKDNLASSDCFLKVLETRHDRLRGMHKMRGERHDMRRNGTICDTFKPLSPNTDIPKASNTSNLSCFHANTKRSKVPANQDGLDHLFS